jgi:ubiquinone/menaquinone biosynthesis C-methylase UbiE
MASAASPAPPPTPASTAPSCPRDEREYVLGTDAQEIARLGLQHRLWSASAHALWERAGIRPGHHVLDVGCGPGYAALDLAMIVGPAVGSDPPGRVIALDESDRFLRHLSQTARARGLNNIDVLLDDAQRLDASEQVAPASIDYAYARWVFCFLKDPEGLVRGLARVVKPGGAVLVQDYFNYQAMCLAPRRAIYERIVKATADSWRSHGGNPDIVAELPAMLGRHGFRLEHLSVNQRLARPGTPLWAWPDTWWRSYVPRLEEMGFITATEREEFFRVWDQACRDPDTFALVPAVFDLIAIRQ